MFTIKVVLCYYLNFVIALQITSLFGLVNGHQKLCLCRCGVSKGYYSGNSRTGRLPKDASVFPHEFPWLAAVSIGQQVVAGSLISDKHVLTAASPLYGLTPDRIIVTLGAHDRCSVGGSALNVSTESMILHPGYSHNTHENDLALIKLKHAVAFSKYIAPVCLPMFGGRNEQLTWTTAWSQTTCTPRLAVLPTLPADNCLKDVDSKLATYEKGCLGPLGVKSVICKNDVGSPVMSRWSSNAAYRLIGIVSTASCEDTSPTLFTRVIDHTEWIYDYIRRDCLCF